MGPEQNDRNIADDIFKYTCVERHVLVLWFKVQFVSRPWLKNPQPLLSQIDTTELAARTYRLSSICFHS